MGATFAYDAWGRPTAGVGAFEVAYAYNGEEYSQVTGLTYLRARYYAPDTASFITCDSVLGEPVDINSQNRYSYAQSDPVNNFDPTGHAITNNAYERAMERDGGINEIYNFYVGSTLASSLGQANVAFNARLGVAQRTDYRSLGAINAISQVSQAEANRHINAGAAAALAIGKLYGCTPGALTTGAIDAFALNVNAAKEVTNQKIAQVKSNKYAQYQQYQRYLAYLAWVAEQERLLAEAYRQYNIMLGNLASAYMQNMAQAIQQQQRAAALSKVISSIKGAAYSAVGSMFGKAPAGKQLPAMPYQAVNIHTQKPVYPSGKVNTDPHVAQDILGLFPVIGEPADFANGIWYATEGDALNAILSFLSVIPGGGWAPAGVKAVIKTVKNAGEEAAEAAAKGADDAIGGISLPKGYHDISNYKVKESKELEKMIDGDFHVPGGVKSQILKDLEAKNYEPLVGRNPNIAVSREGNIALVSQYDKSKYYIPKEPLNIYSY